MTLELGMITIDCEDPQRLAAFWTGALGVSIAQDYGDFLFLTPAREGGPTLGFQRVPEPRAGKNRVHIDFGAHDREEEVKRLVELGATEGERHEQPGLVWTVLTDPEGNEFCVANQASPV
ncbi:VOC family protein [Amycolatopsis sp. H20-H5]|uniref:VOC family protein n=1 Tax=Amycolatopsis sp. H20-H5 TaxID=3046309 RepID=UPI002DBEC22C|nr:VOC family protein [Amycolatopsis sp. H20-H5]MEC3980774.1 VOC family protein [Amycolatopsis sp. H20-H5]